MKNKLFYITLAVITGTSSLTFAQTPQDPIEQQTINNQQFVQGLRNSPSAIANYLINQAWQNGDLTLTSDPTAIAKITADQNNIAALQEQILKLSPSLSLTDQAAIRAAVTQNPPIPFRQLSNALTAASDAQKLGVTDPLARAIANINMFPNSYTATLPVITNDTPLVAPKGTLDVTGASQSSTYSPTDFSSTPK